MTNVDTIIPPEFRPVQGLSVFLAGPIQGADWWHKDALTLFKERYYLDIPLTIASPRRYDESWNQPGQYENQVDWETCFLERSAANGVIMFWCSKEFEHNCSRAYAQTTRFEMGEWLRQSKLDKTPVVIGIEPGYTGEKYVRHRLNKPGYEHIPVTNTLEETVEASIFLLSGIYEE